MQQHGTQLHHLSARVFSVWRDAEYSMHPFNFNFEARSTLTFPVLDILLPNHCPTRLARMPHVGRCLFPCLMSATLADWVPVNYRANRFSRVHEAFVGCFISFAQAFCLELHITAINWQVLQAPNNSTVKYALLHVQVNIVVGLLI